MEYRKLLIAVFCVMFSAQGSAPSFFFPEDHQTPAPMGLRMPVFQRNRSADAVAQALFPGQGVDVKRAAAVAAVALQKQQAAQQPAQEGSRCVVN